MPDSFTYEIFRVGDDARTVSFDYLLTYLGRQYHLSETMKFPVVLNETPAGKAALRALHIALGISYYKTFLPPVLEHPYLMDEDEAAFWNDVWRHGLGEFLYVNHLPSDRLARFTAQAGKIFPTGKIQVADGMALLGIGGGKDSIVAGELLKSLDRSIRGFVMATGPQLGQAKAVAEAMGIELLAVERTLDHRLLDLQEMSGAYKGHVPISLIFGLVGTVLAIATDSPYVVVANEASASIPRHTSGDEQVNHQWSKSFVFEQQLQQYIHDRIAANVTYFSVVRELTSVGVAKLFVRYPQYFEVFTSDNFVFRIDPARRPDSRWSLESPKSLSSFILLAPWLNEADMLRTFGRNFLNEPSLETLFLESTGQEGEPPLDCVGTPAELTLSLNLAYMQDKFRTSALMQLAQRRGIIDTSRDWDAALIPMLALQQEQALPTDLKKLIEPKLNEELGNEVAT